MVTAASVIGDMKLNDVALPGGNPNASWNYGGSVIMGADWRGQATPTWWSSTNKFYGPWNAYMPWFVLWDGQGHQANLNTRLHIYDIQPYLLINGIWMPQGIGTQLSGEAFSRNLIDQANNTGVDSRVEAGGGISVRIQPWSTSVYHGWSSFRAVDGANIRGVHCRYKARLILHDPNGVDDRNRAVYCVQAGGDAYVYSGQNVRDFNPAGYTPGTAISKFKRVTTAGIEVACTTLDSAYSVERSSVGGKASYFVMSEAAFLANLPPGVTIADTAEQPPSAPPPPPPPVGRKTLWISGNAGVTVEDGTTGNPINTVAKLRAALQTYGPTGVDIRKVGGSIWTGLLPEEIFHYNGITLKGDDWVSDLGHFEGGVRKTDWVTVDGAPSGKQLWKCTSMANEATTVGFLQPGCLSIDDQVIAQRNFASLAAAIEAMDDFSSASSYDPATNTVYLMLATGDNPNTLMTQVSQTSGCVLNYNFSNLGNKRTGIVLEHLRFKRCSGYPINLSNLPGVVLRSIYGKHIGGRHRTVPEGKFIELFGGCDNFLVEGIKAEGVAQAVVSAQIRDKWTTQNKGTIRKVEGIDVGSSLIELAVHLQNGGSMNEILVEEASIVGLGNFTTTGKRPDGGSQAAVYAFHPTAGSSTMDALNLKRVVANEAPIAKIDINHNLAGRTTYIEGCQGAASTTVPYAFGLGHLNPGSGVDTFYIRACAIQGYRRGLHNLGGQHSFKFESVNNTWIGQAVGALDMMGVANTELVVQNNVGISCQALVRAASGAGSSVVNNGGNYVNAGTVLGMSAVGTDDVGAATPTFVGLSVGKPAEGSALYTGGTALLYSVTDRLGSTFVNPWSQGAYAKYLAIDGYTGGVTPIPGGGSGVSVWEQKFTADGMLAWAGEPVTQLPSTITGITGVPSTRTLIINEVYQISATVTGTGQFNPALTYEVTAGSQFVDVNAVGRVTGRAVGPATVRISSVQNPNVFVEMSFAVVNYTEATIYAEPPSLQLDLLEGTETVRIFAGNIPQAKLPAISNNSLVATTEPHTGYDGRLKITPVRVGNASILVTKVSRSGGVFTLTIPVTVGTGQLPGDIKSIFVEDHVFEIDDGPFELLIKDQDGELITDKLKVTVSKPGYVEAPHVVKDGRLSVYPVAVGIATVTVSLEDPIAGTIFKDIRVEVIPVGGTATPIPIPPPPISPENPDPEPPIAGDHIFEVLA